LINEGALCGFFAMTLYAAFCDAASFRIPNLASVVIVLTSPVAVDWIRALLVAGLVFLAGLALFARGLVGGGDVKFLAATVLWAGAPLLLPQLLVTGLAGGVLALGAVVLQRMRRFRTEGVTGVVASGAIDTSQKIPYGVAIAAGAFFVGARILIGSVPGGNIH
jgi:prepilin peptidase CpaA